MTEAARARRVSVLSVWPEGGLPGNSARGVAGENGAAPDERRWRVGRAYRGSRRLDSIGDSVLGTGRPAARWPGTQVQAMSSGSSQFGRAITPG